MWNRCKTLLRDHSVPEVTLKACPKHYSVSAIPETLTVRGPKRPPTFVTFFSSTLVSIKTGNFKVEHKNTFMKRTFVHFNADKQNIAIFYTLIRTIKIQWCFVFSKMMKFETL